MASAEIHKVKWQHVINILVNGGSKLGELHQGLEQYNSGKMRCQKHRHLNGVLH
jgi:hypothetical protein